MYVKGKLLTNIMVILDCVVLRLIQSNMIYSKNINKRYHGDYQHQ